MNRADFLLSAKELAPIILVLRNGLIQRPTPEGTPHFDLQSALESAENYFHSVRELGEAGGNLSADDLLKTAEGMVAGYHCLWERPFPLGLEKGQILAAAVLERPMRDLLRGLERLVDQAEHDDLPAEPLLTLDADEEAERFNNWLDTLPYHQRLGIRPPHRCGLTSLAAAFLLGWWIGGD